MASELRVLFDRQGDGWTLRLVPASGSGTPGAPFPVALSEKEYEGLRWYLEDYMDLPDHGSVVRARGVEERIEKWGRALYDALFTNGHHRGPSTHTTGSMPRVESAKVECSAPQ